MTVDRTDWVEIGAAAEARVARWVGAQHTADADEAVAATSGVDAGASPDLLGGVRSDEAGFTFTRRVLESVIGASDPFTAALGLRAASREVPESLPGRDRLAVRAGGIASVGLPWAVLPLARRWLRDRVRHLVLAVRMPEHEWSERQRDRIAAGLRLAVADHPAGPCFEWWGLPVLGPEAADLEVARLIRLTALPEVTTLAFDPARITPGSWWSLDADVEVAATRLQPLVRASFEHGTRLVCAPTDARGAALAAALAPILLGIQASAPALAPAAAVKSAPATEPGHAPATEPALQSTAGDVRSDASDSDQVHDESSLPGAPLLGVRVLAEFPKSHETAVAVIAAASAHVARGGAPLELIIAFGDTLGDQRRDSILSGLAVPALDTPTDRSAQWLRLVDLALREAVAVPTEGEAPTPPITVVAATEDPHLVAAALALAEHHGAPLTVQLRTGVAPALQQALVRDGTPVRLAQPLIARREFAGTLDHLVRLAAESADPDAAIGRAALLFEADDTTLHDIVERAGQPFPPSHRTQRRAREWDPSERDQALFYRPPADPGRHDTGGLTAAVLGLGRGDTGALVLTPATGTLHLPVVSASGFANEPDTDASRAENRRWVRERFAKAQTLRQQWQSGAGDSVGADAGADPHATLAFAHAAGLAWGAVASTDRAARLRHLALGTAAARDRLFEVLAAADGSPAPVIDAQINEAIDAARYLGQLTAGLGAVRGAKHQPDALVLIVTEAGVPFGETAEAVLAMLGSGSAVVLAAPTRTLHVWKVVLDEWEAAGLPQHLVSVILADADAPDEAEVCAPSSGPTDTSSDDLTAAHPIGAVLDTIGDLVADDRVSRAVVLGSPATARALARRRPDLHIDARFRTLGSTLIAPGADIDTAAAAAVQSAFGAGPGDPRTARVLVLQGSTAGSARLRTGLRDAVQALRAGDTGAQAEGGDPLAFEVGPLPEPPSAAGLRALTQLAPGEEWLIAPVQLDEAGLLWHPGVRVGVRPDASFWADASAVPVLGVATAHTLDEAMRLQIALGGGGIAALHSHDEAEVLPWLDHCEAATLVVGRSTRPARIERQPGGAWGGSGLGDPPLSGAANRLTGFGSWQLLPGTPSKTLHLRGLRPEVQRLIEAAQESLDYERFDRVRRAALSDALSWGTTLGRTRDGVGLGVEHNLVRRWVVPVHVRLAEQADAAELFRVLAAGLLVAAPLSVSTGAVLPAAVLTLLESQGITVSLERDDAWLERLAVVGPELDSGVPVARVRLIGGDRVRTAEWLAGVDSVSLNADPVTMAGPVELFTFVREQAVSIRAHRFGLADTPPRLAGWIAHLDSRPHEQA